MRKFATIFLFLCTRLLWAQDIPFGQGTLQLRVLTDNAVRIQYTEGNPSMALPEYIYLDEAGRKVRCSVKRKGKLTTVSTKQMQSVGRTASSNPRFVGVDANGTIHTGTTTSTSSNT